MTGNWFCKLNKWPGNRCFVPNHPNRLVLAREVRSVLVRPEPFSLVLLDVLCRAVGILDAASGAPPTGTAIYDPVVVRVGVAKLLSHRPEARVGHIDARGACCP